MFSSLYMLAMLLTHGHAPERAIGAATTVVNVVATEDASWAFPALAAEDPWAARAKLGRLLIVWSVYESGLRPDAIGDSGHSVGIMQLSTAVAGVSRAELLKPHANYAAAVALLRRLTRECGSLPRALGAYASGTCNGAPALVERRCAAAGGCT